MTEAAIRIDGVRKTFGPKVAVDGLSLVVPRGSLCGFIGPNGAGKTTTIRMIMSIIFPDTGSIQVLGKGSALESKDRIGYLPEERGLYKKMKVGAFLTYVGQLKGISASDASKRAASWLQRVELGGVINKRCEELSKGMQQKVQFIAAVLHEPELIILDEVFSGLDPMNRRLMRDLIDEQHRAGRTVIFSTHAMFEAEQLCDQIFMIHQGRKMLDGPLTDVLEQFDTRSLVVETQSDEGVQQLRDIEGVAEVITGTDRGADKRAVQVLLCDGENAQRALARIASTVAVKRIEVRRVTLEEVFLEVVRRSGGGEVDERLLAGFAVSSGEGGES